ncbi:MAG: SH3 domain-containing protein [Roseiflexaceae bacterium]|nr:SH3 domain-containing protein [Roseiflexaceae bacterium]
MARDDRDLQDAAAERPPRRTDRLEAGGGAPGEPINPQWRSSRSTSARNRPARAIPTSSQDFALWLQYGGWRVILAAVAVIGVAGILIVLTGQPAPSATLGDPAQPTPNTINQGGIIVRTALPTVTPPALSPTAVPAKTGAKFTVTGTNGEGLFLRAGPTSGDQVLMTMPEGSVVTIIGEDEVKPDRVWKHVKTSDGQEGWAGADWLKPTP